MMRHHGSIKAAKYLRLMGILYITMGLLCNQLTLTALLSPDGILSDTNILLIWIFDFLCLGFGIYTIYFRTAEIVVSLNMVSASLLFLLLLGEIYLNFNEIRVMLGPELKSKITDLRTPDMYLHHTLKKNAAVISNWGGGRTVYYTNSLGYRDALIRTVAPITDAQYRILFLGDSFVEGVGVTYEDSFIGKLVDLFSQDRSNIELLNSGVVSYAPSLAYGKLKQFLDGGYTTDEVVFMLDYSDIGDEQRYRNWQDEFDTVVKEWEEAERKAQNVKHYNIRPRLMTFLVWKINLLLKRTSIPHFDTTTMLKETFNAQGRWTEDEAFRGNRQGEVEICKEYLRKMMELCKENDIRFSFVIWPWPQQMLSTRQPSNHQVIFSEFARSENIRMYDLFPLFLGMESWERLFFPRDIHWNEDGHEVVAKALHEFLLSVNEH